VQHLVRYISSESMINALWLNITERSCSRKFLQSRGQLKGRAFCRHVDSNSPCFPCFTSHIACRSIDLNGQQDPIRNRTGLQYKFGSGSSG
jgi:hypothetical protein